MTSPLNVCGAWAKTLRDANRQPAPIAIFFIEERSPYAIPDEQRSPGRSEKDRWGLFADGDATEGGDANRTKPGDATIAPLRPNGLG